MKSFKFVWDKWCGFWFDSVSLVHLAMFRIILSTTMLLMYLARQSDWRLFYTDEGFLPRSMAMDVIPEFFRSWFHWYFWPDSMMGIMHAVMLVGLLGMVLGIGSRIWSFATWVLYMSFMQRNFGIAFGADVIGGIFLLYLSLTQCHERLSIKSWWRKRQGKALMADEESDLLTRVLYRMAQVQLCVIYMYTGMEKLKGGTWWDGTALWTVFANPQMVIGDMTFLKKVPLVIAALTFGTLMFEIYFPVLIWIKKVRPLVLISGFFFHLGIGVVMALGSFTLVMIAPYVLFMAPSRLPSKD